MSSLPGEAKKRLAFYVHEQVGLLLCLFSGFSRPLKASGGHIM